MDPKVQLQFTEQLSCCKMKCKFYPKAEINAKESHSGYLIELGDVIVLLPRFANLIRNEPKLNFDEPYLAQIAPRQPLYT